jgi:hypothetical protein
VNIRNINKIYEMNRKYEALRSFIKDIGPDDSEIAINLVAKKKSFSCSISKIKAIEILLVEKKRLEKSLSGFGVEI